jgi:multicomponent Na+:H+ antiporter subunit F
MNGGLVTTVALGMVALGFLLALVRVARGPTVADRALGADVALSGLVGAVALVAIRTGAAEFLDVVLVATLLGFLATVALSVLVGRRGS